MLRDMNALDHTCLAVHRAHADSCRWRTPFWRETRVMDARSDESDHLGFCGCGTIPR